MTAKFFIPRSDRKLGDRYDLLECLGDGSYGWVWKALRPSDGGIVAVKIPKEQGKKNDDLAEGRQLVGQVSHPNVVDVYWMGRVPPDREWYVIEMEYFPSATLAEMLDRGTDGFVASYARLLNVFDQVLAGVAHLHRLGMSHGDIKPQNILVAAERVKITDFGSSVLPEDMYARTRENGGTILYSAPEIVGTKLSRGQASARYLSDIYSLGVLLYHLVTARVPHNTLSQVARHSTYPRARELNSSVSPALDEFIHRCLESVPSNRWPTVDAMISAFGSVRCAQLDFTPTRILPAPISLVEDWSTQAMRYLESGECGDAELVARTEFESSNDEQAFLLMAYSSFRDGRYFDCVRDLESGAEIVGRDSSVGAELRRLALTVYLEIRQLDRARAYVSRCLLDSPDDADLLLKQASILAVDAHYQEAAEQLLALNRRLPGRPAILRRLVTVFEQLRDSGKAVAFLRAYFAVVPGDSWAVAKLEEYSALGLA